MIPVDPATTDPRPTAHLDPAPRFLAHASQLLAQSLDYETTITTVAKMALPYLGSWSIVDLIDDDQSMRRVGIIHPDPAKQVHARRLGIGWPPERSDPLGLPRAVVSRTTEVIRRVPDEMLEALARNGENLRDLRALGIGSLIVVPLIGRESVLGAITFVSANTGHPYSPEDVELAEDIGARCAMALDNARLFRRLEETRERAAQVNERLVLAVLRQQELAEEAREANQAKSHFLATLSHEIRTPITAMLAYADLFDLGIGGPLTDQQKEYVAKMRNSGQELVELIDDVLDVAGVEAGRARVTLEPHEASEAVAAAIAAVELQASAVGVKLRAGDTCLGSVYLGDSGRVRQILVILLTNALKFTDPGGTVVVSCGSSTACGASARLAGDGPWIFLSVEDDGIGISSEDAARIFEAFVQVDHGDGRKRVGSGLGLAIAMEFAHRMGGDLTLRSAPGEGSCFTLWLPAA